MNFSQKYQIYLQKFENSLSEFIKNFECEPPVLRESLLYSLNCGGKRIRPVLAYASAELFGAADESVKNFALAIELIHTYSLIHDDLPEMDDDDFRRGKPSNHKVFGTGNAVLAGDGLLNTAHTILIDECFRGENYVKAAKFVSECAGIGGMISGQSLDLLHEGDKTADEDVLLSIYDKKTARMITAPLAVPAILSGKYFDQIKAFGGKLGLLFQITDDILDVEGQFSSLGKTIGKDGAEGKYTAVALYGLEKSKALADGYARGCVEILDRIEGDTSFLKEFVSFVRSRKS